MAKIDGSFGILWITLLPSVTIYMQFCDFFRVLDLVEIVIKKQPSSEIILVCVF